MYYIKTLELNQQDNKFVEDVEERQSFRSQLEAMKELLEMVVGVAHDKNVKIKVVGYDDDSYTVQYSSDGFKTILELTNKA